MNSSSLQARWIVIPPFRNDLIWRRVVHNAIVDSGWRSHDYDADAVDAPLSDPRTILLTSDVQKAFDAGATKDTVVVIISEPGIRLPDVDMLDAPHPHVASLTDLMAKACRLPADRIFHSSDFADDPVEILDGVHIPKTPSPVENITLPTRLTALNTAVAVLDPTIARARWEPDVFNYDCRSIPGGTRGELDLTGRPRFLISGPYITLPPGRWRAVYQLAFDQAGSRPRFRLDWGSQATYASYDFVPGRAGAFEITQDYLWTENAPAELRIVVLEGVFHGRMNFSGAEIIRVD